MSIEHRLFELEERQAIRDLYDRYIDTFHHMDWEGYKACFTADCVWEAAAPFNVHVEKPQGIVDMILAGMAEYDFIVQWTSGHIIKIAGNTATGRVGLNEFGHGAKSGLRTTGTYYDELVKVNGEWKFSKRRFVPKYFDGTHRGGNSFVSRPS